MEENKNKQEEPKKLTYEQLYNVALLKLLLEK